MDNLLQINYKCVIINHVNRVGKMDYKKVFILYHNILGIDLGDVNMTKRQRLIDLCKKMVVLEHDYLPDTCYDIESEFQLIIWTLVLECSDDLEKIEYYNAVIGLLNITTQLNLIPDDCKDYILHFKRLNSIIINTLYGINRLAKAKVIDLWNVIINSDEKTRYRYILEFIFKTKAICFKPIILAMYGTENNRDFKMFDKGSHIITYHKLCSILSESVKTVFDAALEKEYNEFIRLSYKDCLKLTRLPN